MFTSGKFLSARVCYRKKCRLGQISLTKQCKFWSDCNSLIGVYTTCHPMYVCCGLRPVYQSYHDDGMVIMRGCIQWNPINSWQGFPSPAGLKSGPLDQQTRPRGYKTFFMLNSDELEILNAHKYKNIKKFSIFQAQISLECYFSC